MSLNIAYQNNSADHSCSNETNLYIYFLFDSIQLVEVVIRMSRENFASRNLGCAVVT